MRPSPAFAWGDRAGVLAFVSDVAFAHVFAQTPEGPRVGHVPIIVTGTGLRFHLAKSNALAPHLAGATALASVGGPGAYVSPNWYAAPRDQVPTWNYLAIEIEGCVRRLDHGELVALLDASSALQERRVGEDWTRAKMDPRHFEAMCNAITGFELPPMTIRATRKLGQNKSDADMRGVVTGQRGASHDVAAALAEAQRGW